MTPWFGIVATISGIVVGWILGLVAKVIDDRKGVERTLRASASVCRDRLLRIKNAADRSDVKQMNDEILNLGERMDRYLVSIAAAATKSSRIHTPILKMMIPILMEHRTEGIDQVIARLDEVLGLDGEDSETSSPKLKRKRKPHGC
jgi:hypothetical protein